MTSQKKFLRCCGVINAYLLSLFFLLINVGCLNHENGSLASTLPNSTSPDLRLTSTNSSLTVTPSPITTLSPTGDDDIWTIISDEDTVPITPTYVNWTAMPNLDDIEPLSEFENWMTASSDCKIPCWAGISPGVTELVEAYGQISKVIPAIGGELQLISNARCVYGQCKFIYWTYRDISGGITTNNKDLVYGIYFSSQETIDGFKLKDILDRFGVPGEIYISTGASGFDELSPFESVLIFPEKALIARYYWDAEVVEEEISACAQDGFAKISIGYGNPSDWSNERIRLITYGRYGLNSFSFKRIEDVTDMSLEDFYNSFSNGENACITTPVEFWP